MDSNPKEEKPQNDRIVCEICGWRTCEWWR